MYYITVPKRFARLIDDKGYQSGYDEGYLEGFRDGTCESLNGILVSRFGTSIADLVEQPNRIDDLNVLGEILKASLSSENLEDFAKLLNEIVNG